MTDSKKTFTQEEVDVIINKTVAETISKMGGAKQEDSQQEEQKQNFFKGFATVQTLIASAVAAGLTAAGMYYFGGDEEISE